MAAHSLFLSRATFDYSSATVEFASPDVASQVVTVLNHATLRGSNLRVEHKHKRPACVIVAPTHLPHTSCFR
jgi:hypothetical protein